MKKLLTTILAAPLFALALAYIMLYNFVVWIFALFGKDPLGDVALKKELYNLYE